MATRLRTLMARATALPDEDAAPMPWQDNCKTGVTCVTACSNHPVRSRSKIPTGDSGLSFRMRRFRCLTSNSTRVEEAVEGWIHAVRSYSMYATTVNTTQRLRYGICPKFQGRMSCSVSMQPPLGRKDHITYCMKKERLDIRFSCHRMFADDFF